MSGEPPLTIARRVTEFWLLVDRRHNHECWPWHGYEEDGYGRFFWDGKMRGAHELALSFTTGEQRLSRLDTCHSCDNPICCNPSHLRFDTRKSNVDEMHDHGRAKIGSRHPGTKLTEDQVLLIRERRAAGAKQKDLAKDFGVTDATIVAIVHGRNWKHVGGPVTNRSKKAKSYVR